MKTDRRTTAAPLQPRSYAEPTVQELLLENHGLRQHLHRLQEQVGKLEWAISQMGPLRPSQVRKPRKRAR